MPPAKKNEADEKPTAEVIVTPDPKALADAGIQPVANVVVTPKIPAPTKLLVDPDLKTPENQLNLPPPRDPNKPGSPADAVPVGDEWKTAAAQEHGARAAFAGQTVREYVTGEEPDEDAKKAAADAAPEKKGKAKK